MRHITLFITSITPPFIYAIMKRVWYFFKKRPTHAPHTRTQHTLIYELERLKHRYGLTERFKEINNLQFCNLTLSIPDFPSVYHQLKNIFIDEEYQIPCDANAVPVCYDCGANVGLFTLYCKHTYPHAKITCFEPDPVITPYLKKNIANNITHPEDITIIEKAVYTHNKGVRFYSDGSDGGSIAHATDPDNTHTTTVPTIRLKELLSKETTIDLLKIDIEGAEYEVLLDCQSELKKVKHIALEYHSAYNAVRTLGALLNILETADFTYYIPSIIDSVPWPVFLNRGTPTWNGYDIQLIIFAVHNAPEF